MGLCSAALYTSYCTRGRQERQHDDHNLNRSLRSFICEQTRNHSRMSYPGYRRTQLHTVLRSVKYSYSYSAGSLTTIDM